MSFDAWVAYVFGRPVETPMPLLRHEIDYQWSDAETIEYSKELFSYPTGHLAANLSLAQIRQGFWALGGAAGLLNDALFNVEIPIGSRSNCVLSMRSLFEDYFSQYSSKDQINDIVFVWWESPVFGVEDRLDGEVLVKTDSKEDLRLLEGSILSTLRAILEIDTDLCRKSALHGIGHMSDPLVRKGTIDRFLDRYPDLSREIREYAGECISGEIE